MLGMKFAATTLLGLATVPLWILVSACSESDIVTPRPVDGAADSTTDSGGDTSVGDSSDFDQHDAVGDSRDSDDIELDVTTGPLGEHVVMSAWTACDLKPGDGKAAARCATAKVPLDYDAPKGETITLYVKAFGPAASVMPTANVWLLHGGPGASAVDDLDLMSTQLYQDRPGLVFYAVDHRGIGGSARLDCPAQEFPTSPSGTYLSEAEVAPCGDYLAANRTDLAHITTSNSARDVAHLAAALRTSPTHPIFVWGGSYGTYIGQRYMQLFPNQPAGVVLDGISTPGVGFEEYSEMMNVIAEDVFDACGQDVECSTRLGPDPWLTVKSVLESLDGGHCPGLNTTRAGMSFFLAGALFYDGVRDLVPAIVYRTERCTDQDVAAIAKYAAFLGSGGASSLAYGANPFVGMGMGMGMGLAGNLGDGRSDGLFYHIATSEMWSESAPSLAEAEAAETDYTLGIRLTARVAAAATTWPSFSKDSYVGNYADYDNPLLMFQGGLDPATDPFNAQTVGDAYMGTAQTYAFFPHGAHGTVAGSLMANGQHCGRKLILDFFDAPAAALDLTCIDQVLPPNFDGRPAYIQTLFGTTSAWD